GPRQSGTRALRLHVVAVLLLLGGALAYGAWRLGQEDFTAGPRLTLLQGNIDQRIRNTAASAEKAADEAKFLIIKRYGELNLEAAGLRPRPALIVWPEPSFPAEWNELVPGAPPAQVPSAWRKLIEDGRARAVAVVDYCRTNVLLGMNVQFWDLEEPKTAR